MSKSQVIVGLVGLPGAGKTTVASYLQNQGFEIITLSDFIKKEVQKARLSPTREVLQRYGNRMRRQYGPQILAQLAIKKIQKDKTKRAVIDGIRNMYEVRFLQIENNFQFIGVRARPKIRYERVRKKRGAKKVGSYSEFLRHEKREDTLGSREVGLRVKECLQMASFYIDNNKHKEELFAQVDKFLHSI